MNEECDKNYLRQHDSPNRGYLSEIFCSIQGEGLYVGERQIFVRCAGCSIGCRYCDTAYSNRRTPECVIYGSGQQALPNPVAAEAVLREVTDLAASFAGLKTIALTGGEPLEQNRFIHTLARGLKEQGLTVYLDTNGIEADGLARVIDAVDIIAMDIKLPVDVGRTYWPEHEAFLRRILGHLAGGKKAFVKVIIGERIKMDEFEKAVRLIAGVDGSIPLVLQPESRLDQVASGSGRIGGPADLAAADLLKKQAFALRHLKTVRVIPQCHKILGVM
jgi:organic radical activating enzyme